MGQTNISINPRDRLPVPGVKSRLVTPRELGAAWRMERAALNRAMRNTNFQGQLQRQIAQIPVNGLFTSQLFPFQIYHLPVSLRPNGLPNPDGLDWRRVRVRAGRYMASSGPIDVVGTDGVANPDIETYLDDPSVTDILVNEDDPNFYFWVKYDMGSVTATVYYGDDPSTAQPMADDWPTFPSNDSAHTLIGWCDSHSLADQTIMQVQQIVRSDIYPLGNTGGTTAIKGIVNTAVAGGADIYANYLIVSTGSNVTTATFSNGVTSITVASAAGITVGDVVSGTHIPAQTTVTSVSGTTIGISNATTGSNSGNYTFSHLTRVAKPSKLRNSISSQVIDGTTYTLTYTSAVQRTKSTTGYTEYQRIVERYLTGDEIWFVAVSNSDIGGMTSVSDTISTSTTTPIVYLDTNVDGREWSARSDQSGP